MANDLDFYLSWLYKYGWSFDIYWDMLINYQSGSFHMGYLNSFLYFFWCLEAQIMADENLSLTDVVIDGGVNGMMIFTRGGWEVTQARECSLRKPGVFELIVALSKIILNKLDLIGYVLEILFVNFWLLFCWRDNVWISIRKWALSHDWVINIGMISNLEIKGKSN